MSRNYQQITRYNHDRPMTEDAMRAIAPSIFATEAHSSRSHRFAPVATIEIVRGMIAEGFMPVMAGQSLPRNESKMDFTKHMVKFRRHDALTVGDNVMEIVLVNGNDGSAAYRLEAGVFRIACLNGMIAKQKDFGGVKIRHSGDAMGKVIEGSYEVLKNAERIMRAPQDWSQIQLTERERYAFARGAHVERFGAESATSVKPAQLLIPRRAADTGHDLWSTFNVIQENAIRGGVESYAQNEHGRIQRRTTREVRGISDNVRVNQGLWEMAEWLAENH